MTMAELERWMALEIAGATTNASTEGYMPFLRSYRPRGDYNLVGTLSAISIGEVCASKTAASGHRPRALASLLIFSPQIPVSKWLSNQNWVYHATGESLSQI